LSFPIPKTWLIAQNPADLIKRRILKISSQVMTARTTKLTLVDLMNQNVDTKRSDSIKQQQILLVIELSLQQIFHPDLLVAHDRLGRERGSRHCNRKYSNFVGRDADLDFIILSRGELIDLEQDAWKSVKSFTQNSDLETGHTLFIEICSGVGI
jgi:hypothetical protein